MRNYAFAAVALLLVFILGVQYQRWSQPDITAELRRLQLAVGAKKAGRDTSAQSGPVVISQGWGVSREELQEELQIALRALRAQEPQVGDAAEGAENVAPAQTLTPEMEGLRDQTSAFIDAAMLRGTWYASDRTELHRLADQITDTQTQFELFRRVSAALNDGTLKPDLHGPLL